MILYRFEVVYGGGAIVLTVGIFCKWNETFFVMLRYFDSLSLLFDLWLH